MMPLMVLARLPRTFRGAIADARWRPAVLAPSRMLPSIAGGAGRTTSPASGSIALLVAAPMAPCWMALITLLISRKAGAFGELAHLVGHHRETTATLLAGAAASMAALSASTAVWSAASADHPR